MQYLFVAGLAYPPLLGLLAVIVTGQEVVKMQKESRQYNPQINEANSGSQEGTTIKEVQPTDNKAEIVTQPPDSTLVTETKPEETVVAKVSQIVEPPPPPTARPFDGCCYVWIEDSETKEVVAGTRLPGAGK